MTMVVPAGAAAAPARHGAARDAAVLKIGGSVLTSLAAYREVARCLCHDLARSSAAIVAVVSAEDGHTDRLLADALALAPAPDADALDLLWSTGELRSVALLTLALRAEGVAATGLNVHQTGLSVARSVTRPGPADLALDPRALRAALDTHDVVVVPGFLATRSQQVVTLGRGGSDWSAVALASAIGAVRCELIKDVAGYYSADPATHPDAAPIAHLDYAAALAMAEAGCPLVQRQALDHARRTGLPLVVRRFGSRGTRVS